MRLRNPGGIDNAIKTVGEVRSQLDNASNHANSAPERQSAFLSWCDNWATPQLGNHFPVSESIFGEVSESYHRIVALPGLPNPQLNSMMHREFKEWAARLEHIEADLWQMKEFLVQPGRLVVLDTSALMEGVFFTEFDWHGLDPSLKGGGVRLVVLSVVTEELDELKRRPGERQRGQARKVLTMLWNLHRAATSKPASLPQASDVTIEVMKPASLPQASDVTIEVMLDEGWHQRMPNNDGEIIDQAVGLRELSGQPVVLASADYTQLYRAAPAGLTAALMPRPGDHD